MNPTKQRQLSDLLNEFTAYFWLLTAYRAVLYTYKIKSDLFYNTFHNLLCFTAALQNILILVFAII